MTSAAGVKEAVKTFILEEFLPGENPDELTDGVELMTAGILDSVAILKLVAFLEDRYKVTFDPQTRRVSGAQTANLQVKGGQFTAWDGKPAAKSS